MVEHVQAATTALVGAACLMCLGLAFDRRWRRRAPHRELARAPLEPTHEQAPRELGRHVACTLHDLNDLLTVIGVFAELIVENSDSPARASDAVAILRSQRRAQLLVRDLFAAEVHSGPEPVTDVGEVLDGSKAILEAIVAGRAELSIQAERELLAPIRPESLERALLNLVFFVPTTRAASPARRGLRGRVRVEGSACL